MKADVVMEMCANVEASH